MKKIEWIWRHLIFENLKKKEYFFRQQDLATLFSLSSSTVNGSLRPLRELGAVKVGGKGFEVVDAEKILYHWANHRHLLRDVRHQLRLTLSVLEIEGLLPADAVPTAYTAVRELIGEAPTDYDKVYCYSPNPELVADRFRNTSSSGPPNLFILEQDPHLTRYGPTITLGQLFTDLWSLPDWYAKECVSLVKTKIDELLS